MEAIPVPAPPKSAFNKNRRVSDLLMSQLHHFQHVAHKQGVELDPALERDIYTEGGAARYIASMTRAMRSSGAKQSDPGPTLVTRTPPPLKSKTLQLAAAATTSPEEAPPASGAKPSRSKRKPKVSKS